jgi:hypothetical protein
MGQPGFGHAKEKGPDCRQQRRDLARLGRVSQRASASTRTALAAAALAEPLGEALPDGRAGLLGDLQQEGPQRLAEDLQEESHEQPPQGSSPHAGAETDQRYRLQRWNRGNEKAPRLCETLRVGGPVWAHSDNYMPECDDRSSHRQIGWSTAVDLLRSPRHPVNPVTEGRRPARPPPAPGAASLGTNGRLAGMRRAGPHWSARHRKPLVLNGHQRSTSVWQNRRSDAYRRSNLGRRRKPALGSNPTSSASLGVWTLELQYERSVDLQVAQQEGALVESPAPQPAGDFGVALAGVA